MSDKLKDILQQLQEHHQSPPENLLDNILLYENQEKNIKLLIDEDVSGFTALQNHQRTVPNHLYQNISNALFTTRKDGGIIKMMFTSRRIAAVLILALSAWLVFYLSTKKNTNSDYQAAINKPVETLKTDVPIATPTGKTPSAAVSIKEAATIAILKNPGLAKSMNKGIFKNLQIDGKSIEVVDNDLLYTLFNCDYKILEPYLESENKKLVMGLDKYSSVTVSPRMVTFMKTMYTTNKRNKPTRKARKAIKALDKWKKTDGEYFDLQQHSNPLDIIELSEFIFDKKKQ